VQIIYNYADDNKLSAIAKEISEVMSKLKDDAMNLMDWFRTNGMMANVGKFQSMLLGAGDTKVSLNLDDHEITNEYRVDVLGIIIDYKLKFDLHLSAICRSAARQVNALRKLSSCLDEETRMIIYTSFIKSNFNYCPVVWHFCGITSSRKLENIQKRALRFVYNDYISSYDQLLQKANMNTLYLCRLRSIAIETFKIMNNIGPNYLSDLLEEKSHEHDMRSKRNVTQPKVNSVSYGINSFRYKGAKIWNSLPNNLKHCLTLEEFKMLIKTWYGPQCNCQMCTRLLN
jgi:hypothetical protein